VFALPIFLALYLVRCGSGSGRVGGREDGREARGRKRRENKNPDFFSITSPSFMINPQSFPFKTNWTLNHQSAKALINKTLVV
jgi:hypothetical protein